MQKQSRVFFQISGAGHEALGLALARHLRPGYDWFFPYYRDQALVLGLGVTPVEVLLQAVGSAEDPASGGRQMPSHWGHRERHIVTQSSPTGSQCIPAVGCAEAGRYIVRRPDLPGCSAHGDELTYVSLGEGACSEGEFWESLNTACNLHLPVLYVVPDNGYAISVPASDQAPAPVAELVRGFRGLEIHHLDGTDYFAVRDDARSIIEHVRAGVGPALIHADVVAPVLALGRRHPVQVPVGGGAGRGGAPRPDRRVRGRADRAAASLTADEAAALRLEAREIVADAAAAALAGPTARSRARSPTRWSRCPTSQTPVRRHPRTASRSRWARRSSARCTSRWPPTSGSGCSARTWPTHASSCWRASRARAACSARPTVCSARSGRPAASTRRCRRRTSSAAAVGQGIRGLRPAPEIQFFDYIWPAMTQIKSEAATIRWRSNGAFTCPMVIRVPIGGYLTGGAIWHSQCGESIFAHIPGLLDRLPSHGPPTRPGCCGPRSAARTRCCSSSTSTSSASPTRSTRSRRPTTSIPFGVARCVGPGDDLTIVTWGATVREERARPPTGRPRPKASRPR